MKSAGVSRALRELGLGPDADERAIKRAYAKQLRTVRPDTDPEGFQRLRELYETALQQATMGAGAADDGTWLQPTATTTEHGDGSTPPPLPPQTAAAGPDAPPMRPPFQQTKIAEPHIRLNVSGWGDAAPESFSFRAFYGAMRERADEDTPDAFRHWLRSQEALYSMALKDSLAARLVLRLRRDPALSRDHLDILLHFFALDTVNTISWPLQQDLRELRENTKPWRRPVPEGPDWSHLLIDPAYKPKPLPDSPWGLRFLGAFLLLMLILWVYSSVHDMFYG